MPYIKQKYRRPLLNFIQEFNTFIDSNGSNISMGEINFLFSTMIWKIFKQTPQYCTANELIGVLECIKLEFYRRQVVPYEKQKLKENGDLEI